MNGDLVIFLLMVVFWIISQFMSWLGKRARTAQQQIEQMELEGRPVERRVEARPDSLQEALRDLADRMGVEVELEPEPVGQDPAGRSQQSWTDSEHRRSAGEHQRTLSEARGTPSEAALAASEHRRTASEVERSRSETSVTAPEHQWVAGEHVRGDQDVPDIPRLDLPTTGRQESAFVRRLRADLTGRDKSALARAMVLKEVLGPPVSLRSPADERS